MSTKKSSHQNAKNKKSVVAQETPERAAVRAHAYILGGQYTRDEIKVMLPTLLLDSTEEAYTVEIFESADGNVDDARLFREQLHFVGNNSRTIYVLSSPQLTVQAQNALLKVLEDVPLHAIIVIIVAQTRSLLPTIHSRVQRLNAPTAQSGEHTFYTELEKVLQMKLHERVVYIEQFLESASVADCIRFTAHCERYSTRKHVAGEYSLAQIKDVLHSCCTVQAYIEMPGAMKKVLMEQLVLSLPILK
jgi:hypothetical protein